MSNIVEGILLPLSKQSMFGEAIKPVGGLVILLRNSDGVDNLPWGFECMI